MLCYGLTIGTPGSLEELNKMAQQFVLADAKDYPSIISDSEILVESLTDKSKMETGKKYIGVMNKMKERGLGYVADEIKRIKKILTEKISDKKTKSFELKINVLSSFQYALQRRRDEL